MRKLNLSRFLRFALSIFLLYHLAVITVMPNPSSLLGRRFSRYLTDYANTLGINTTWQFFSPGPAPVFYLEYDVETSDVEAEAKSFQLPEKRRASYYDELYNRTLYSMRFFVLAPIETFERYFVRFLCKQHPEAEALSIRTVGEPVKNIERAGGDESFDELTEKMPIRQRQRFTCAPLETEVQK
jgi:hypothetical protein